MAPTDKTSSTNPTAGFEANKEASPAVGDQYAKLILALEANTKSRAQTQQSISGGVGDFLKTILGALGTKNADSIMNTFNDPTSQRWMSAVANSQTMEQIFGGTRANVSTALNQAFNGRGMNYGGQTTFGTHQASPITNDNMAAIVDRYVTRGDIDENGKVLRGGYGQFGHLGKAAAIMGRAVQEGRFDGVQYEEDGSLKEGSEAYKKFSNTAKDVIDSGMKAMSGLEKLFGKEMGYDKLLALGEAITGGALSSIAQSEHLNQGIAKVLGSAASAGISARVGGAAILRSSQELQAMGVEGKFAAAIGAEALGTAAAFKLAGLGGDASAVDIQQRASRERVAIMAGGGKDLQKMMALKLLHAQGTLSDEEWEGMQQQVRDKGSIGAALPGIFAGRKGLEQSIAGMTNAMKTTELGAEVNALGGDANEVTDLKIQSKASQAKMLANIRPLLLTLPGGRKIMDLISSKNASDKGVMATLDAFSDGTLDDEERKVLDGYGVDKEIIAGFEAASGQDGFRIQMGAAAAVYRGKIGGYKNLGVNPMLALFHGSAKEMEVQRDTLRAMKQSAYKALGQRERDENGDLKPLASGLVTADALNAMSHELFKGKTAEERTRWASAMGQHYKMKVISKDGVVSFQDTEQSRAQAAKELANKLATEEAEATKTRDGTTIYEPEAEKAPEKKPRTGNPGDEIYVKWVSEGPMQTPENPEVTTK